MFCSQHGVQNLFLKLVQRKADTSVLTAQQRKQVEIKQDLSLQQKNNNKRETKEKKILH